MPNPQCKTETIQFATYRLEGLLFLTAIGSCRPRAALTQARGKCQAENYQNSASKTSTTNRAKYEIA